MRKRITASLTIIAIFALAIAAFAYTRGTTTTISAVASCCKKDGDSCPMKGKGHDDKSEHAKMSCCKKHVGEHAKADGHECCGDSCPMKKGEGKGTDVSSTADGKSCCDNCDCCSKTSA